MILLQQFKMGKHGVPPQYMMKPDKPPKPCGHPQGLCVPLTDYLSLLIIVAIILAIKKINSMTAIFKVVWSGSTALYATAPLGLVKKYGITPIFTGSRKNCLKKIIELNKY